MAWGAYVFAGRVRLSDGLIVLKREPVSKHYGWGLDSRTERLHIVRETAMTAWAHGSLKVMSIMEGPSSANGTRPTQPTSVGSGASLVWEGALTVVGNDVRQICVKRIEWSAIFLTRNVERIWWTDSGVICDRTTKPICLRISASGCSVYTPALTNIEKARGAQERRNPFGYAIARSDVGI